MIYVGSKNRLSKYIVPIIQSYITDETIGYLEPFVGGANIIDKIECKNKIGYDIHEYLIECLKSLRDGWIPPYEVSREDYIKTKESQSFMPKNLVGYIGFELSFGAKWFGGYAKRDDKKHRGDIYSYKSCMKQAPNLKGIKFECMDYEVIKNLKGYVIYCDPPYRGTLKYKTKEFDYERFYDWCREMSQNNTVLISEYWMPNDFECIWEKESKVLIDSGRKAGDENNIRIEKLYTYKVK